MLSGLTAATTQTEYYLEVARLVGLFVGASLGAVAFFVLIYLIVFYSHYYR